jgi:steroid delta-isomerase-like uncharacterized protein
VNARALSAAAAATCFAGLIQVALSKAKGGQEKMNLEQNKTIVRDYLNEIVNKGNMAAFDSYFSGNVVFNNATDFKQRFLAMRQAILGAFPDHHLTIQDQIAEGDRVVTRVTMHGTHQGPFNGIAPTGRQVEWSGIAMDRIADGKVVEMWHVQNTTALMLQIGGPPPADSRK